METRLITLFAAFVLLSIYNCLAQEIWDGPSIVFSKPAFANWTLPENQDRITDNVWITRADTRGIFNFRLEKVYTNDLSPQDTEWGFGTTDDIDSIEFTDWETTVGENPPSSIDQPMVVHLISEDIYINLVFRSWGQGGSSGGSFSYERSTNPDLGISTNPIPGDFSIYPNPAKDHITIIGLQPGDEISIYSVLGTRVLTSLATTNSQNLNVSGLTPGIFLVQVGSNPIERLIIR